MRLTAAEKHEIIRLVEGSDLSVRRTLRELGVHRSTFYARYRRYQAVGAAGLVPRPAATRRHWNRIPLRVWHRVVEAALADPVKSPRELAWQFTDRERHFLSESSVYRILKAEDLITSPAYVVLSAAKTFAHPTHRPNELWQTDFTYLQVVGWSWYYLSTVLDDYARYIIAWMLRTSMQAADVMDTLDLARAKTGTIRSGSCIGRGSSATTVRVTSRGSSPSISRPSTTIILAGCRGRDRPVCGPTESRVRLPVFLVEDGLITDAQVRRLREKRMSGKTLAAAAAAAGMSERTARHWQSGALPSTAKAPRTWRTREDPFAGVWESEVVPQLVADTEGRLQVLTLFTWLCRRHPGRFQAGQLRTLQRRVRDWRVQYGPDREVYFEQVAVPGREAAFDFTDASDLGVTIRGVPFPHLLFEWVLSYSKWTYVGLAFSETFEALVAGLQGALWTLGAAPAWLRHDNLSAATHELKRSGGRQLTVRFQQVLDHYGLRSSRIQPGKPHENGVAEQSHFRTKTAIEQALLLRGDRDFDDESAYLRFVRAVVDEARNAAAATRLAEERPYLRPLPSARIPEYTTFQCVVRKWSTIRVGGRIYSVPSRLIGHTVEARQHPSTVEVRYGGQLLCTMPRLRGAADHRIDYRHIIGSLVRKPGAFARYRFREELFPSLTFRAAYDALGRTHGERADVEYVRLLHLAATTSERQVEVTLRARLDAGAGCDYASVQAEVRPPVPTIPVVHIPRPDLSRYDALLTGGLRR